MADENNRWPDKSQPRPGDPTYTVRAAWLTEMIEDRMRLRTQLAASEQTVKELREELENAKEQWIQHQAAWIEQTMLCKQALDQRDKETERAEAAEGKVKDLIDHIEDECFPTREE